ncbi:T9SS sorting signal type C domain-containing protein [Flavobacterium terrigena]|uniref:T9SS sorting signal type C domain-containing protein n=1 Tax=Flavobacterium terrigena TaxID=402734 RepID=A0A1H6RWZ5_9FLAO|nr:T9SS sorting signal type C domain-containing protein [Flavobacterium terrigena]SEI60283.1 hypothetical protein SAMN05660918_1101 [Flavobacterium terrigena]
MNENYNSLGKVQGELPSGEKRVRNLKNKVSTQKSIKKSNWFFCLLFLMTAWSNAQVTTNSGSGLAPTYTSLANAITALNAATISSPVVITLTGNETAPAGGFRITAQGDATNTIIIEGVTSTITASLQTAGQLNNAIFKLVGADYITIRNFTMQENGGNTVLTPAASNTMTEWGVALLYLTTTNGAQNNTIQGNTISLNRTYRNSYGIYSNSTHTDAAPLTDVTATTGSNTGLSILSNNISNVNMGIVVVGPKAAIDHNQTLTIGGVGFGNTITDFGTNISLSTFANVSGTCYGILVRNTANFTVSHNSITSSVGGYAFAGTFRGIYVQSFSNAPTGTLTQVIDYNSISMKAGFASTVLHGVSVENTTGSATTSLSISHNDFHDFGHTVAGTGQVFFINNVVGNLTENMNSNTFTNMTMNTTGSVTFFNHNVVRPANAICNVNNNAIVTGFTKTGAGGNLIFYQATLNSPSSVMDINTGNNFSNITLTGATTVYGWRNYDGGQFGSVAPYGSMKNVSNNTFTNIVGGTNYIAIMQVFGSNMNTINNVSNNTITNVTGGGAIRGIESAACGSQRFENNTISGLSSTGASQVTGLYLSITSSNSGVLDIFKNKIYNLEATNVGGSVSGIYAETASTINLQNNFVGDLRATNADGANPLVGINVAATAGGVIDVSHNTVWLSGGSAGSNFGSSAVYDSASAGTVTMRNNIFVNKTTPNGTGLAAAYRRSTTDLTNYNAASNTNLFFGSTIFTDGTNTDITLKAYKARVTPRDVCSVTEDPTFLSTVGTNPNFLHIDTTVPMLIESGGTPIAGITTDFDGDARNITTPDIGADEFNGTYIAPTNTTTTVSACDNYTWSVDGVNYTATGVYNYTEDCRHTETLDVRINKVWNGTTSADWNDPSNWTPAGVPVSTDCVVIPDTANEPVVGGTNYSALGLNLAVNADASLNVTATNTLKITDVINVNPTGTLIVEDDASIVQINNVTNVGNIQYKRTANVRKHDYVYWSSPVAGFASTAVSPGTSLGYQYDWIPAITGNTNEFGNWRLTNETMVLGKGYCVRAPDSYSLSALTDYTATFTGVPNNGDITIPISRGSYDGVNYATGASTTPGTKDDDNWNLVGNPYPSAINAIDFLILNTNIAGFVNIWTHGSLPSNATNDPFYGDYSYNYTPTDYITYNSLGASSGNGVFNGRIAAGQGFFVSMLHTSAGATENLIFNNTLRSETYNNSQFYKNAKELEKHRIWFDLVSSSGTNVRSLLGYVENATNEKDRLFDAFSNEKLSFNIFSLIDEEHMLIQGRKLPFDNNDKINIGVTIPQEGVYKIALSSVDGLFLDTNQNIYLEDKLLNVIFNLKEAPYSFTGNKGTTKDRFVLRYTKNDDVNHISEVTNQLTIYDNNVLTVESGKLKIKDIVVFDVLGKLLLNKNNVNDKNCQITNLNRTSSMLVVKVTLEDNSEEVRKIIY